MILHNERKYILKQKVKMDEIFGLLMIELIMMVNHFLNYMELDS